jgi:hypothetical protein
MPAKSRSAMNKVVPPSDRTYMDPAEIEGRDDGTGAPTAETHFVQPGPEDSGGDASNPSFNHLSGDTKFSGGISR